MDEQEKDLQNIITTIKEMETGAHDELRAEQAELDEDDGALDVWNRGSISGRILGMQAARYLVEDRLYELRAARHRALLHAAERGKWLDPERLEGEEGSTYEDIDTRPWCEECQNRHDDDECFI